MVKSKIDFPYPVLEEDGDDYVEECSFILTNCEKVEENELYVKLRFGYSLTCSVLEQMVDSDEARVAIYLESANTSYRRMVMMPCGDKLIDIIVPKKDISKKIIAKPYVVANKNCTSFMSNLFNQEFFGDAMFEIHKGDILATEGVYEFVLDDLDEFKNCTSIFSIRKDEHIVNGVKVNYNAEKIEVWVNKDDHSCYQKMREWPQNRLYMSNMFILPALVEALEAMKRKEEGIDDKRWFMVLEKQMRLKGIELSPMSSSMQIANMLLGDIVHMALQNIVQNIEGQEKKGEIV